MFLVFFFFQAEDGIRDRSPSRGLGDVYKRQEEWNESDDFKRVGTEGLSGEDIGEKSLTYWADVWRRFRENKLAIFGLILLGLIVVLLFIGPMVTGQDYQLIDASIKNQGPSSAHWFGTDDMGRDLFTRVCVGGRISVSYTHLTLPTKRIV